MKVTIRNQQRLIKVNQRKTISLLRKALLHLGHSRAELSLLFVNDRRMRLLNQWFRGVDRTTDVLSFPQQERCTLKNTFQLNSSRLTPHCSLILGDIVINLHKAKKQAREYGNTFDQELKRLLVHGLLHLLHYDHEMSKHQKDRMAKKERELLALLQ